MFNLLKKYNELLEVDMMSPEQRTRSLRGVFNRDIQDNRNFCFHEKKIFPTPQEGMDKMELLFDHLTRKVVDESTRHREYDRERSIRLHWIKHHTEHAEEEGNNNVLFFSTVKGREKRTYIYDQAERYVIVLEPKETKRTDEAGVEYTHHYYYLLTAYKLEGKDDKRNKIERLFNKKHSVVL